MDLICYLWKAYKAAPNEEFHAYIKDMKNQADDGRATFNAEQLMTMTGNKYVPHSLDEDNEWGKLSDEQEQIIAMNAKMTALKNNCNKDSNPKKSNNKQGKQGKSSSKQSKSKGKK